jgi:hypothetical protein
MALSVLLTTDKVQLTMVSAITANRPFGTVTLRSDIWVFDTAVVALMMVPIWRPRVNVQPSKEMTKSVTLPSTTK